ncbi:hypothetical protein I317_02313 [Kwoniella heveanensis CBS 569]|nr:hypothetical protein I317_02313 [Kwoniella heveanensis CBS 569]
MSSDNGNIDFAAQSEEGNRVRYDADDPGADNFEIIWGMKQGASFLELLGEENAQKLLLDESELSALDVQSHTSRPQSNQVDGAAEGNEADEASVKEATGTDGLSTTGGADGDASNGIFSVPTRRKRVDTRRNRQRQSDRRTAVTTTASELYTRVQGISDNDFKKAMRPIYDERTVFLPRTRFEPGACEYGITKVSEWVKVATRRSDSVISSYEPREAQWTATVSCTIAPTSSTIEADEVLILSLPPTIPPVVKICRFRTQDGTDRQTSYQQLRNAFLSSIGTRIKTGVPPELPQDQSSYTGAFKCTGHVEYRDRSLSPAVELAVEMSLTFGSERVPQPRQFASSVDPL